MLAKQNKLNFMKLPGGRFSRVSKKIISFPKECGNMYVLLKKIKSVLCSLKRAVKSY